MSKVFRGAIALAAALGSGTVFAGTIGPVSSSLNNPNHDLNEVVFPGTYPLYFSAPLATATPIVPVYFDFEGLNSAGAFTLQGHYDGTTVFTDAYSASGDENTGGFVSYNGVIDVMDPIYVSSPIYPDRVYFLMGPNTGSGSFIWLDLNAGAADISPAPLPTAAGPCAVGLAMLGVGGWLRRRKMA